MTDLKPTVDAARRPAPPTDYYTSELNELVAKINAAQAALAASSKTSLANAIALGEILNQAKGKVRHGEFGKLLKDNCHLHERTAQRYMVISKLADNKSDTMSVLTINEALRSIYKDVEIAEDTEIASSVQTNKGNGGASNKPPNASDLYDKVQEKLIEKLQALPIEEAKAAAEETAKQLRKTVQTMEAGAKNALPKAA